MKISDTKKGLIDLQTEKGICVSFDATGMSEEEEVETLGRLQHEEETRIYDHNAKVAREWEKSGPINFGILQKQENGIGKRIEHLRQEMKMGAKDLFEAAGIAKTTLYRIEKGQHIPTLRIIKKLLVPLSISLADFSSFPENFEEWKDALTDSKNEENIFTFKKNVIGELENAVFVYENNSGKNIRVPLEHMELFRKLIKDAFGVLDLLPQASNNKKDME